MVYRRVAQTRPLVDGAVRSDYQFLQAAGSGIRSADQLGLFGAQPVGSNTHSDV